MLLVVMCVGYFLVLLDVTIVSVALPSIASGLDADVASLQWVVDGYAIALASLMLAASASRAAISTELSGATPRTTSRTRSFGTPSADRGA